jgi:hypothetical protein
MPKSPAAGIRMPRLAVVAIAIVEAEVEVGAAARS